MEAESSQNIGITVKLVTGWLRLDIVERCDLVSMPCFAADVSSSGCTLSHHNLKIPLGATKCIQLLDYSSAPP